VKVFSNKNIGNKLNKKPIEELNNLKSNKNKFAFSSMKSEQNSFHISNIDLSQNKNFSRDSLFSGGSGGTNHDSILSTNFESEAISKINIHANSLSKILEEVIDSYKSSKILNNNSDSGLFNNNKKQNESLLTDNNKNQYAIDVNMKWLEKELNISNSKKIQK